MTGERTGLDIERWVRIEADAARRQGLGTRPGRALVEAALEAGDLDLPLLEVLWSVGGGAIQRDLSVLVRPETASGDALAQWAVGAIGALEDESEGTVERLASGRAVWLLQQWGLERELHRAMPLVEQLMRVAEGRPSEGALDAACNVLLLVRDLTAADLVRLARTVTDSPFVVHGLLTQREATVDLAAMLVRRCPVDSTTGPDYLAMPGALSRRRIRLRTAAWAMRTEDRPTQRAWAASLTAVEARRAVRMAGEHWAFEVLEALPPVLRCTLRAGDLMHVLESSDGRTRARAIALLADIEGDVPVDRQAARRPIRA